MPTLSADSVIERLAPDARAIADGHRRMTDIWHNRATDSLPIVFSAPVPDDIPRNHDMRRHVEDAEQMLHDLAVGLLGMARAGSDGQLVVRADTGTGTLATIAGCSLIPMESALPWTTHLTREAIDAFDPMADFVPLGVMPRVRELYTLFRERLPDNVHLYCADTQGPFDLAHLLYGEEIFYAVYDDPEFVHTLLEKATTLYIRGTALLKSWIGEPADSGYHLGGIALAHGGVRVCEDTPTLLSPTLIEEFVLPYQQRALEAFGGGFVHYCGDNDALWQGVLGNPAVRGVNLGNPERFDFAVALPQLIEAGKCYMGSIARTEGEDLATYFRRVIGYTGNTQRGLIFLPCLHPDEADDAQGTIALWRDLQ